MKQRFIREGDELKDNSSVVVRGGPLDPEVITPDALRHHDIYGTYGISVFAIRDTTLDELAQQTPLIRFELLTVIVVGVLREAGLLLQPTGRNPRHFTIEFDALEEGVAKLCDCEHEVKINPYYVNERTNR